jgi:hypothetical protein
MLIYGILPGGEGRVTSVKPELSRLMPNYHPLQVGKIQTSETQIKTSTAHLSY